MNEQQLLPPEDFLSDPVPLPRGSFTNHQRLSGSFPLPGRPRANSPQFPILTPPRSGSRQLISPLSSSALPSYERFQSSVPGGEMDFASIDTLLAPLSPPAAARPPRDSFLFSPLLSSQQPEQLPPGNLPLIPPLPPYVVPLPPPLIPQYAKLPVPIYKPPESVVKTQVQHAKTILNDALKHKIIAERKQREEERKRTHHEHKVRSPSPRQEQKQKPKQKQNQKPKRRLTSPSSATKPPLEIESLKEELTEKYYQKPHKPIENQSSLLIQAIQQARINEKQLEVKTTKHPIIKKLSRSYGLFLKTNSKKIKAKDFLIEYSGVIVGPVRFNQQYPRADENAPYAIIMHPSEHYPHKRYLDDNPEKWKYLEKFGPIPTSFARYANDPRGCDKCVVNAEFYEFIETGSESSGSGYVPGRVFLRAIKNIKPGEEIFVDYGSDYFAPKGTKRVKHSHGWVDRPLSHSQSQSQSKRLQGKQNAQLPSPPLPPPRKKSRSKSPPQKMIKDIERSNWVKLAKQEKLKAIKCAIPSILKFALTKEDAMSAKSIFDRLPQAVAKGRNIEEVKRSLKDMSDELPIEKTTKNSKNKNVEHLYYMDQTQLSKTQVKQFIEKYNCDDFSTKDMQAMIRRSPPKK